VHLLFSFTLEEEIYPCALVEWFKKSSADPDPDVNMWTVEPKFRHGVRVASVVHLDAVLRGAHLLPVFGEAFVPQNLCYFDTLNVFRHYYVNKYVDNHGFETVF
jgi:hypothetical protein